MIESYGAIIFRMILKWWMNTTNVLLKKEVQNLKFLSCIIRIWINSWKIKEKINLKLYYIYLNHEQNYIILYSVTTPYEYISISIKEL